MLNPMYETLHLTNTLTRSMEPFASREANVVRIFTCGPSTYRRPHIGNYRSFLYEDLLVRYLEYLGYRVDRVINFTDVEDKTVSEASQAGRSVQEITEEVQRHFFEEAELLRLKLPERIPRATTSVDTAVKIIQALVSRGYAYCHEGKYYFAASKAAGFGRLFGLDTGRWPKRPVRFGFDTYEGRRWNLGDFVLWHPESDGGVMPEGSSWDTDIGRGRPGWNIQDPAMIVENLGDWIDVQCGGIDNLFRHHDYNIAVMEAYSGMEFARFFLHGEHLVVDGEVMSKSTGNVIYPEHVLDAGYGAPQVRYFLLHEHYRRKLNFTWERIAERSAYLDEVRSLIAPVTRSGSAPGDESKPDGPHKPAGAETESNQSPATVVRREFERNMNNDLSAGPAVDAVYAVVRGLDTSRMTDSERTALADALLQIDSVVNILVG